MRQKELRIGLVCYGGVSLAIYMHGVTKELWKLARASRAFHAHESSEDASEAVYRDLLDHLARQGDVRVRVLPDIITGASAGGINAVFLAQAIHSGESLEPLTDLWLETADVDRLLDPEARNWTSVTKFWAPPIVELLLSRPGNVVSDSVAPEMRRSVRRKLSRLVRSRWFQPPFSGIGFSALLDNALEAMSLAPRGRPLLPPGHPLDLSVTATDFHGFEQTLPLHSPPFVEESEHRLAIDFRSRVPANAGEPLADRMELILAARGTASFPGAFPPLKLAELDQLARQRDRPWKTRDAFLERIMPQHVRQGDLDRVSLIDGSVLVNAPFSQVVRCLKLRPAVREVDRRIVYIDPSPAGHRRPQEGEDDVGFFRAIMGSISQIPRNQPIRDDLEAIGQMSQDAHQLRRIIGALRIEVEEEIESVLGRKFMLGRPTTRRLAGWRSDAQQAAARKSGFAYQSYAQSRYTFVIDRIARLAVAHSASLSVRDTPIVAGRLRQALQGRGLDRLADPRGGASDEALAFFADFDLNFRIRRLRLLARVLTRDWPESIDIGEAERDEGRATVYRLLSIYLAREAAEPGGEMFADLCNRVLEDPGSLLDYLARWWDLRAADEEVDAILAEALAQLQPQLRRKMLLTYLGFPFYDVATLALLRNEDLSEFDPVKIDRISPDDAGAIREGGAPQCLRGTEFYNFGAFFSRAYRENDYLWGRLHGAERMIDLVCSTVTEGITPDLCRQFKQRMFLAILEEEESRLRSDPGLVSRLRKEVRERMAS